MMLVRVVLDNGEKIYCDADAYVAADVLHIVRKDTGLIAQFTADAFQYWECIQESSLSLSNHSAPAHRKNESTPTGLTSGGQCGD